MSEILAKYLDILAQPNKLEPMWSNRSYVANDVYDHMPRFRAAAHGDIMEIGVRTGMSTFSFLAGLEENGGHLYSVDIDDLSHGQRQGFLLGDVLSHPQWTFINADSVKEVERVKASIPAELDLLFIDGCHLYDWVFSDLINYAPMAQVIMMHDTAAYQWTDIPRALADYMKTPNCRHKNVFYYTDSHGLGVLS